MDLSGLPVRTTPDREYYGAIVDLLVEQNGMLAELLDRIPEATRFVVGELVDIVPESANIDEPGPAVVEAEPEPSIPEPESQPIVIREPVGTPPPQVGHGSSRGAWAAYASSNGITVDVSTRRDQIITACQQAGIPT